jgi:hypothetical protein
MDELVEHVIGMIHARYGDHCGRIACLSRDSTKVYKPIRVATPSPYRCWFTNEAEDLVIVRFRVYNTRLSRPQQTMRYVVHESFLTVIYTLFLVAHSTTAASNSAQLQQSIQYLKQLFFDDHDDTS